MYLVRRGHFRSRDKDGGHSRKPFCAQTSRTFSSCDLDLEPMTFIDELDPYIPKMYPQTKNELSTRLSKVIVLQTDRHTSGQMLPKTLPTMLLRGRQ